ncbi:translation initiation factor IF-2 [Striga asiatica]|uniref:Translation initiation factor IF-2 n=1 Tax=Striga asiatica TaxID=4170 RepID=A0A5A7P657_STRAF|nr:translation initiation factor IF-2 [Striga asiatica]
MSNMLGPFAVVQSPDAQPRCPLCGPSPVKPSRMKKPSRRAQPNSTRQPNTRRSPAGVDEEVRAVPAHENPRPSAASFRAQSARARARPSSFQPVPQPNRARPWPNLLQRSPIGVSAPQRASTQPSTSSSSPNASILSPTSSRWSSSMAASSKPVQLGLEAPVHVQDASRRATEISRCCAPLVARTGFLKILGHTASSPYSLPKNAPMHCYLRGQRSATLPAC